MARRKLKDIRIMEISGVDRPAQEGARMVIMKRDASPQVSPAAEAATQTDLFQHQPVLQPFNAALSKGVDAMSDKTEVETKAEDDAVSKELDALKTQLKRAEVIIGLGTVEKTYFDTLGGKEADAFLAKSDKDRASEAEAAQKKAEAAKEDANPVVHKCADGTEYRKNDDPRLIALAKQADADRAELVKEREARANDALTKRAEETLAHLPGPVEHRRELLKAVDGIEDDEARKSALEGLKAADAVMSSAFQSAGVVGQVEPEGSPDAEIRKMAKAYAKENKVSEAVAYDKVLQTDEGAALYAKSLN